MVTLWPRFLVDGLSLLGLGDICVPGAHLAMLARFDHWQRLPLRSGVFLPGFIGYMVGLCAALSFAFLLKSGQPALIYLIPSINIPPILVAWRKGLLRKLWLGEPTPKSKTEADGSDAGDNSSEGRLLDNMEDGGGAE